MNTPLDQDIRSRLLDRRGEWPAIASASGVSHSWISKFVRGQIPNPGYATLTRLGTGLGAGELRRANSNADSNVALSEEARAA